MGGWGGGSQKKKIRKTPSFDGVSCSVCIVIRSLERQREDAKTGLMEILHALPARNQHLLETRGGKSRVQAESKKRGPKGN